MTLAFSQQKNHRNTPKKKSRWIQAASAGFAIAACVVSSAVHAQAWPARPVTIISPYGPGGTNDVVARVIADHFSKIFGQPFVVENRAGAAGIIGSSNVIRAKPDGYTLLSGNNGALVVQSIVKSPSPYNPATELTPIAKVADSAAFIGISSALPVSDVNELIALAKREPGKLNYSSAGSGSFGNFLGEYFKLQTGTNIVHVPNKGSSAALTELMAGRIQLMFDPLVLPQKNSGRIKVLATTNSTRFEAEPAIPTVKEAGGPEMDIVGWFGLFGPANLPKEVVDKLEAAAKTTMDDPEVKKIFLTAGISPAFMGHTQFKDLVQSDLERYADIKKRAGMSVE